MEALSVPYGLGTEYVVDPVGVDERVPRFSWCSPPADGEGSGFGQKAYQIVVETLENPENPLLHAAAPTVVWDSGRVDSEQSRHVPYAGVPLQPMARYRWRVRIWSAAPERAAETSSRSTGWSEPASFETGPFSHEDWGGARWIGGAENETAPLLRTGFVIDDRRAGGTSDPPRSVVRARLYFSGLGYGEPYLDGVRVGERVLDPAPTDYDRTVLFSTYDVTSLLQVPGDHVLAAMLGGGRYDEPVPNVWLWERAPWRDRPKLLAQLVIWYADGTVQRVVTGPSWRASGGPIRSHSLYTGELYDARQEQPGWNGVGFDDTTWAPARLMTPPRGTLRSQQLPPIMPRRVVNPIGMSSPEPGVVVYDLGEQIAGWARLRINGPAGTSVQIRYGERLLSNGRVDIAQPHIQGEIQTDTYILRGGGDETYEPHFSYKGFQYVEVSGYPGEPSLEALTGVVLHSAVRSTAEFDTDAEDVNRLHHGVRTALLNNLHGVPTDTPVFEKNGWTGDAHLTAEMAAYNFDLGAFWTKWLQDWVDAQLPSGEFPPIVPTPGWGYRGSEAAIIAPIPAWDVAYFEIPWTMYRYYGDERVLARHYDGQRRYLDHLFGGFVSDGVVLVGLGDYLPPGHGGVPPEGPGIYETAYTYRILSLLRSIASVLGRDADIPAYDELAEQVRQGFDRTFYSADSGTYHGERPTGYRQSANVIALAFGLVPKEREAAVLDRLIADIHERDDHLDTGVIGTKFLFPLLTRHGHVDLAYKVAMQKTYPGYGHWLELGSTALYEMWHAGSRSRDHHFFGHVDRWFVEDLAGVSPAGPGYSRVRIAPNPPSAWGRARVALDTVRGRVEVEWRRTGPGPTDLELSYAVPAGVSVEFTPGPLLL